MFALCWYRKDLSPVALTHTSSAALEIRYGVPAAPSPDGATGAGQAEAVAGITARSPEVITTTTEVLRPAPVIQHR